jgi:hypothetical protein
MRLVEAKRQRAEPASRPKDELRLTAAYCYCALLCRVETEDGICQIHPFQAAPMQSRTCHCGCNIYCAF